MNTFFVKIFLRHEVQILVANKQQKTHIVFIGLKSTQTLKNKLNENYFCCKFTKLCYIILYTFTYHKLQDV